MLDERQLVINKKMKKSQDNRVKKFKNQIKAGGLILTLFKVYTTSITALNYINVKFSIKYFF